MSVTPLFIHKLTIELLHQDSHLQILSYNFPDLIFYPKNKVFCVMTNRYSEKFVPLWTQVVVDDLEMKKAML